ncbi:MAG: hypothetical protein ACK56F_12365 [bacterium]
MTTLKVCHNVLETKCATKCATMCLSSMHAPMQSETHTCICYKTERHGVAAGGTAPG